MRIRTACARLTPSVFGRPFVKRYVLCYPTVVLSVCLSVCLWCLSVTLMYCGQTVGWIKMKIGVQIGLGSGHIVLDGYPDPPPQRDTAAQFWAHICYGQMAGWSKTSLGMEVGLDPGDFLLDGDSAPPPEKGAGAASPLNFGPMSIVAKRLDGSRWHLAWRWASVQATLC